MENAKEVLNAFDRAIQKHKNRPKIEVPKRKFFPCFSIPAVSSLHVFYKRWESQRAYTILTCPFAVTAEAKALMEQILASNGSKEEIASRVEALLAGSELSSSRGVNGGIDGSKQHFSFSPSLLLERV